MGKHVHIQTQTRTHTNTNTYTYKHKHVHIQTQTRAHTNTNTYTYKHKHVHIQTQTRAHTNTYTYKHKHVHIQTQTRTRTNTCLLYYEDNSDDFGNVLTLTHFYRVVWRREGGGSIFERLFICWLLKRRKYSSVMRREDANGCLWSEQDSSESSHALRNTRILCLRE